MMQSNVLRAWNPHIPILLAPAMNTQMYTHPITAHHLGLIKAHLSYIEIIHPIEKILACGDVGMGGMAEWGDVVGRVVRKLNLRIRSESDDEEEEEEKVVGELDEDTKDDADNYENSGNSDEEEDEGIRAGGEEHEDEKRDNEEREREEEEEERQHLSRLASRVDISKT
jgi:phosphopantothenoylcysteine decarboxylase